MKIIRAIVDGERNPEVLASYRDKRCAKSEEEIVESLVGNCKQCDFCGRQLRDCDAELLRL